MQLTKAAFNIIAHRKKYGAGSRVIFEFKMGISKRHRENREVVDSEARYELSRGNINSSKILRKRSLRKALMLQSILE